MSKISVIIPIYNSAKTIVECIDSVISELTSNPYDWELILVNDGSKDNSKEIVCDYLEKSGYASKIRFIDQQNGGAAAARNAAIVVASGDFIAFNDSDDRWIAGKLKLQMTYMLENPDIDMIGGGRDADKFSSIFKKLEHVNKITLKDNIKKNYFGPPMVIIRKNIIDRYNLLFDATMRTGGEEGSLFYPILYYGNCVFINVDMAESILGKNQWGESGLTANITGMEKGVIHNKITAYKKGYISLPRFIFVYLLSFIKLSRRWLIIKIRKLRK